jgi:hypothetical protein
MRIPLLIVLPAALLVAAEAPRAGPGKPEDVILPLERQVLEAYRAHDAAALRRLLADEYLEVSGAGRLTRAELLDGLADLRVDAYAAEEARLVPVSPDAVALTYRLTLRGSFKGRPLPAGPLYVSSVWVRQKGGWRRALTQATPAAVEAVAAGTGKDFEAELSASSVRYTYRGSGKLEDVTATVTVHLEGGAKLPYERFWGGWRPGEAKEVHLGLAGVDPVERIDFAATATRGGQKYTGSVMLRR